MRRKRTGKPEKVIPRRDPFDEWAEANVENNDPNQRTYPRSPPMAQLKPEGSPMLPEGALVTFDRPGPDGVALYNTSHPYFGIGDLVALKSGGPLMTVFDREHVAGSGHLYKTSWFVGENLRRECFGEDELVLKRSALGKKTISQKALKRGPKVTIRKKKYGQSKNHHRRSR